MFCPNCGNADQKPETYCRQCGSFLPDFAKLKSKEIPPEVHLKANSVLSIMSAVVSGTLAILLHIFFTGRENTPVLIYLTIGFLTAMFFWQVQTFWRTRLLKKQLSKRKKSGQVKPDGLETNPLGESAKAKARLSETTFSHAVPSGVIENTTKHLGEKAR
jgi:hypothetical protein